MFEQNYPDEERLRGWVLGAYSSYELINALTHRLEVLCKMRGKAFTGREFALLEDELNRNRFARFASMESFLQFAENAMFDQKPRSTAPLGPLRAPIQPPAPLESLQGPLQQPRANASAGSRFIRSVSDYSSSDANWDALEDARALDEIVEFLAQDAIENPAKDETVSFASPGFARFLASNETGPSVKGDNIIEAPSEILGLLESLRVTEPELARLAVFRFFGGLTLREISSRIAAPIAEVNREWNRLRRELIHRGLASDQTISLITPDETILKAIRAHPELLRTLDWRLFEKVLAALLERLGFEVELKSGTKDGGIDIFAIKGDPSLGTHRYLIQAKRWSHRVGVEPVRELLFLQSYYRVTKGCLATTATFTRGALRLAEEYRWQLELKDYHGLREWVERATGQNSHNKDAAPDGWCRR